MTPTTAGLVGWAIGIASVVFVWAVAFRARPEAAETPAPATTRKEA